jgi:molecular chaperone GrpE
MAERHRQSRGGEKRNVSEAVMPHRHVDEAIAEEAVDPATLLAENESLRDRLLRALADAENTRRRAEQTAQEARQYAIADFAREMLVIADNLKRTIDAADRAETVEHSALIEGVRATERLLEQTLHRFGVRKIDALGKRFDPNLHEAVMQVEEASQPAGTVVRVVEDGYTIHDRLLRPARVFVARGGSNSIPATELEPAEVQLGSRSHDPA